MDESVSFSVRMPNQTTAPTATAERPNLARKAMNIERVDWVKITRIVMRYLAWRDAER